MNERGISVKQLTPFEYQKKKQLEEESKQLEHIKNEHEKREKAIRDEM